MSRTTIKQNIDNNVTTNGNGSITGAKLNAVLKATADETLFEEDGAKIKTAYESQPNTNPFTDNEQAQVQANKIHSENTSSNPHNIDLTKLGIPNVENTSDANKPVSTAQAAINSNKVDKEGTKVLSDENYSVAEKAKVALNTAKVGITTEQASAITLNTTHRTNDGKDHSDVVLNNTHRTSDGKNHADVVLNNSHRGNVTGNPHEINLAKLGIPDVENKSSATIRSEIVEADIPIEIARGSDVDELVVDIQTVTEGNTVAFTEAAAVMTVTSNKDFTAFTGIAGGNAATLDLIGDFTVVVENVTNLYKAETPVKITDQDGLNPRHSLVIKNIGTTESPSYQIKNFFSVAVDTTQLTATEITALLDAYLGTGWREASGDILPIAIDTTIAATWQVGSALTITYTYSDGNADVEDTTGTGSEYDIRRYASASAANADTDRTGGRTILDSYDGATRIFLPEQVLALANKKYKEVNWRSAYKNQAGYPYFSGMNHPSNWGLSWGGVNAMFAALPMMIYEINDDPIIPSSANKFGKRSIMVI